MKTFNEVMGKAFAIVMAIMFLWTLINNSPSPSATRVATTPTAPEPRFQSPEQLAALTSVPVGQAVPPGVVAPVARVRRFEPEQAAPQRVTPAAPAPASYYVLRMKDKPDHPVLVAKEGHLSELEKVRQLGDDHDNYRIISLLMSCGPPAGTPVIVTTRGWFSSTILVVRGDALGSGSSSSRAVQWGSCSNRTPWRLE
jgi:hypothetical protein